VNLTGDQTKNARQFELARQVGANVVRTTLGWRDFEPQRGVYDQWVLNDYDTIVTNAANNGQAIIIGLARPPCWASGDPNKNCSTGSYKQWYPPQSANDYAAALGVLVNRYGSRVLAWEIWNEPDLSYFWGDTTPDPARYVGLVKAAKTANPGAFILGGAVSKTDTTYVSRMYDAGVRGYMDALSIHPYVWLRPAPGGTPEDCSYMPMSLKCGVPAVRDVMVSRGDNVPIWFTEFGWSSQSLGEATQADYLKRAFNIIAGFPYVPVAVWYMDIDRRFTEPTFSLSDYECCYGVFRADNSEKPAASNFRSVPLR
jgi:hypothetical protein